MYSKSTRNFNIALSLKKLCIHDCTNGIGMGTVGNVGGDTGDDCGGKGESESKRRKIVGEHENKDNINRCNKSYSISLSTITTTKNKRNKNHSHNIKNVPTQEQIVEK